MSEEIPTENPTNKFESGRDHARKAAEDLKSAAQAKVSELRSTAEAKASEFRSAAETKAAELRSRAENAWGTASDRAKTFREDGEEYVREKPMQAVLTALAAGFVLGLLIRR